MASPKFLVCCVVGTPGALAALEHAGQVPAEFLDRHICGDWGERPLTGPDDYSDSGESVNLRATEARLHALSHHSLFFALTLAIVALRVTGYGCL